MNRFILLFICFVCAAVESHANRCAEKIVVDPERIYSVSSFEEASYFTAFTRSGELAWEVPFSSKILNWTIDGGQVFIFSKDRSGNPNYITCVDSTSGTLVWEKRIWAPKSQN
jgi:outer membrane protein assembly factor BamB